MSALVRTLTLILAVALVVSGCGATQTAAPSVLASATPIARAATETSLPPTATPATATSTTTPPTPATAPTQLPLVSTTVPYDEVPEQLDDGWQTASLADVGINPAWMTKMLEAIYTG